MKPIRIEKHLSEQGILSRRETKACIEQGFLSVNGKTISKSVAVHPERDTITIDPAYAQKNTKETYITYKPIRVLSSRDVSSEKKNLDNVFPQLRHLAPVGRLDYMSEGLLLFSNDGMITKAVTGKEHLLEKTYVVTVRERVLPWMMQKMLEGITIEDGPAKAVHAKKLSAHQFSVTLTDGRKHQVRRMANHFKLTVERLQRTRIDTLTQEKFRLRPGHHKKLSSAEVATLKRYL